MKMMTKKQVYELVKEFKAEKEKTIYTPHYYKYKGEIRRRSYDDATETARYLEILRMFYDEKGPTAIFKCSKCGETKCYGRMEIWDDKEILGKDFTCSLCYEEMMGEDL